ncbi:F0F1 ATP synthase subunit epsilon [Sporocytophaga myxococcoides]|nr:F0F1 ATP synthase subunit epsilon [Sporocytophaga myxococcoides]
MTHNMDEGYSHMHLKILLPFKIYAEIKDVRSLVVETTDGQYGYLPHRLDCVAIVVPGILFYKSDSQGSVYLATDEGVLRKTGKNVYLSVRDVIGGVELGELYKKIESEFLTLDEQEKEYKRTIALLESNFIKKYAESTIKE